MSFSYALENDKIVHGFPARGTRDLWVNQGTGRRAVPACNGKVRYASHRDTVVMHGHNEIFETQVAAMFAQLGVAQPTRKLYPYLNAATGEPAFAENAKEAATDGRIPLAPITVLERFLKSSEVKPSCRAVNSDDIINAFASIYESAERIAEETA